MHSQALLSIPFGHMISLLVPLLSKSKAPWFHSNHPSTLLSKYQRSGKYNLMFKNLFT